MARTRQVPLLLHGVTDDSGDPLASGKVYFYETGTTTDKTVWTDAAKTTPASQPVVLDSSGRAQIYADGVYRVLIDDSSDVNVHDFDPLHFISPDGQHIYDSSMPINVRSDGSGGGFISTYLHQPTPNWPTGEAAIREDASRPTEEGLEAGTEMIGIAADSNSSNPMRVHARFYSTFSFGQFVYAPGYINQLPEHFPRSGEFVHLLHPGTSSTGWQQLSSLMSDESSFTPSYSAAGSMTFTSVTTTVSVEVTQSTFINIFLDATGTTGGTGSAYIEVDPGFEFRIPYYGDITSTDRSTMTYPAAVIDGASIIQGYVIADENTDSFRVYKIDGSNWGLGSGRRIIFGVEVRVT